LNTTAAPYGLFCNGILHHTKMLVVLTTDRVTIVFRPNLQNCYGMKKHPDGMDPDGMDEKH
jgi:hypothetical protein